MTFDIDNIERWRFCDNEADAERLLALVIDGRKTATSSLLREYREENEPIPQAGDLSAICHWDGRPACVVDTTAVEVVPFDDVTDEMAALEGECRTAEGWRRIHAPLFGCAPDSGECPAGNGPAVVFERFEVLAVL